VELALVCWTRYRGLRRTEAAITKLSQAAVSQREHHTAQQYSKASSASAYGTLRDYVHLLLHHHRPPWILCSISVSASCRRPALSVATSERASLRFCCTVCVPIGHFVHSIWLVWKFPQSHFLLFPYVVFLGSSTILCSSSLSITAPAAVPAPSFLCIFVTNRCRERKKTSLLLYSKIDESSHTTNKQKEQQQIKEALRLAGEMASSLTDYRRATSATTTLRVVGRASRQPRASSSPRTSHPRRTRCRRRHGRHPGPGPGPAPAWPRTSVSRRRP
jgi:hypothetical protein